MFLGTIFMSKPSHITLVLILIQLSPFLDFGIHEQKYDECLLHGALVSFSKCTKAKDFELGS